MAEKRRGDISAEDERGAADGIERAGYVLLALLFLLVVGFGAVFIYAQYCMSEVQSIADQAVPELWKNGDGTYELSWGSLEDAGADFYYVNVSTYALGGEATG